MADAPVARIHCPCRTRKRTETCWTARRRMKSKDTPGSRSRCHSGQGQRGEDDCRLPEEPRGLLPGGPGGLDLLYPKRQDQAHGRFAERQRSSDRHFGGPGDFFGEGCLAGQSPAHVNRRGNGRVLRSCDWPRLSAVRMLHYRSSVCPNAAPPSTVPHHSDRRGSDLINYSTRVRKRLARVLLLLAHFGKEGKPEPYSKDQPGNAGGKRWHYALQSAGS